MSIAKTAVKVGLEKFGIPFAFPNNSTDGETITCWADLHSRNGDTEKLRDAILADNKCLFTVSDIPANYLASLRLKRKN